MITRRATLADARPIAALQLRAWWRNYQDIVDTQHFSEWDEESRTARWIDHIVSGPSETLIAEVAGNVCGFVSVGPSREADSGPTDGEVWALYVDPPAQGAGVGTLLLAEGEQALRAAGHRVGVLRTLRDNGLARTFCERHGWTVVDGSAALHQWDAAHVLYRREL